MFYNLKIAIRNLRSNNLYTIINITGLAVSLAAVILIMLWVWDELSYDKFYKRADDIYLVNVKMNSNGKENYWSSTPTAVSHASREEIPGVENACAINRNYDLGYLEYEGEKFFGDRYIAVDTTFFRIFDTQFIEGSAQNALPDPYSIVLTQTLAKKIFGNESALGKVLKGSNGQEKEGETYYVSGVIEDQPKNASLEYNAIFSFERSRFKNTWLNWSWSNFLLLKPGTDKNEVAKKLLEIQKKNFSDIPTESFLLQPLTDIRLHSADGKETGMASVRLFSIIALGLLTIACINYVNLATARANKRNKEMAVKKIMGAKKWRLLKQLLNETVLLCIVSQIIALSIVYVFTPYFNRASGKQLDFDFTNMGVWIICGCTLLFVIFFSGVYPALKLSSFNPIQAFRGQTTNSKTGFNLRKILIIFQFTSVAGIILVSIVMNRQLHYIQNLQLGYDKEQVIQIQAFTNLDIRNHSESFQAELEKESSVLGVASSRNSILYAGGSEQIQWDGIQPGIDFNATLWGLDRKVFSVLDIPIVEGNSFSGTPADSSLCYLNETAIRQMGIENPIGKTVSIPIYNKKYTIAGIVKDFHFEPLDVPIGPLIMYLSSGSSTFYVKIQAGKTQEAIAATERVWKKYSPVFPISYQFLDESYDQMYQSEQYRSNLFNIFSVIIILISCLGLFGLVTYTAESKTKEIGIRKVLGASAESIVKMLSKEFLILVGVAMFIAFPLANLYLDKMLQDYAYRISISWWMFGLAGAITILLTLITVGWQAIKAATANPVKSIKTE